MRRWSAKPSATPPWARPNPSASEAPWSPTRRGRRNRVEIGLLTSTRPRRRVSTNCRQCFYALTLSQRSHHPCHLVRVVVIVGDGAFTGLVRPIPIRVAIELGRAFKLRFGQID